MPNAIVTAGERLKIEWRKYKAQSIATRTFALLNMACHGKSRLPTRKQFNVGPYHCQASSARNYRKDKRLDMQHFLALYTTSQTFPLGLGVQIGGTGPISAFQLQGLTQRFAGDIGQLDGSGACTPVLE